jgi:hypothetical protein
MTTYTGNCFCGAVEFDVTGEQIAAGYCHCRDCAHWGASPVSAYAIFPAGSVAVTKGADNIATYNKTPHVNRKHCTKCGGHVFNELPEAGLEEVFPDTAPDLPFEPQIHIHYGSKTLTIRDGLPKFRDMPAELGGSGEMVPE